MGNCNFTYKANGQKVLRKNATATVGGAGARDADGGYYTETGDYIINTTAEQIMGWQPSDYFDDLPQLRGSEKQVSWANEIRKQAFETAYNSNGGSDAQAFVDTMKFRENSAKTEQGRENIKSFARLTKESVNSNLEYIKGKSENGKYTADTLKVLFSQTNKAWEIIDQRKFFPKVTSANFMPKEGQTRESAINTRVNKWKSQNTLTWGDYKNPKYS